MTFGFTRVDDKIESEWKVIDGVKYEFQYVKCFLGSPEDYKRYLEYQEKLNNDKKTGVN